MAIKKLSTPQRPEQATHPVVNAVDDETLRDEVALVVAATGRPVVFAPVPARSGGQTGPEIASAAWRRAPALFIDAAAAARLSVRPQCEGAVVLVRSDLEAEDLELARRLAPVYSASLPADNVDIVEMLGRAEAEGKVGKVSSASTNAAVAATPAVTEPGQAAQLTQPVQPAQAGVPSRRRGKYGTQPLGQPQDSSAICTLLAPAVGGAGASVAAAAFSLVLSRQQPVCLVDADELGGGLDLILGMETASGLRWQDFSPGDGRLDGSALYEALPTSPASPSLKVLTWARVRDLAPGGHLADSSDAHLHTSLGEIAATINCLIQAGIAVVVDCPKRLDFLTGLGALADYTVIVTPTAVRGIAAGSHLAEICARAGLNTAVAVRHQQHRDVGVDDVEYALDLPIVGEIEFCKKLAKELDVGGLAVNVGKLTRGLAPLFERAVGAFDG